MNTRTSVKLLSIKKLFVNGFLSNFDKRIKLYFSKADLTGNKKGQKNTFISLKLNKSPRKIYLLYKKNYFRLNPYALAAYGMFV